MAFAKEVGAVPVVLVAPSPTADVQTLVDLLVATRELAPAARLVVTNDYEDVSDRMTAP